MRTVSIQQIETYDYFVDDKLTNDQIYDKILKDWNEASPHPNDVNVHFIIDELEETYLNIERAYKARIRILDKIADQLLKEHDAIQEITIVPQDNYSFMIKTKSQIKYIPTKNTEELNKHVHL